MSTVLRHDRYLRKPLRRGDAERLGSDCAQLCLTGLEAPLRRTMAMSADRPDPSGRSVRQKQTDGSRLVQGVRSSEKVFHIADTLYSKLNYRVAPKLGQDSQSQLNKYSVLYGFFMNVDSTDGRSAFLSSRITPIKQIILSKTLDKIWRYFLSMRQYYNYF